MFGLFKTPDIAHPQLGAMKWLRSCWHGTITLPEYGPVPLSLGGSRKGPDESAVAHAVAAPEAYRQIRGQLETALFEHYEPYAEAVREGHLVNDKFPTVSSPAEALLLAKLEAVLVVKLDGELATEFCYTVPWDEEHLLGARFRGTRWVELCGSTLLP